MSTSFLPLPLLISVGWMPVSITYVFIPRLLFVWFCIPVKPEDYRKSFLRRRCAGRSARYVDTKVLSTLHTLTAHSLTLSGPQLPPRSRKRCAPREQRHVTVPIATSPAKRSQGERFLQAAKPRGPAGHKVFSAFRKEVFIDSDSINIGHVSYSRLKASTFPV